MDKGFQVLIFLSIAALSGHGHSIGIEYRRANKFYIVSRDAWGARPPKTCPEIMTNPVPYVIIHHSYIPAVCTSFKACAQAMRSMQNMHQDTNDWNDIGYSFAIGGDGRIYAGRGWSSVGAHAPTYNNQSIGICLIGDWSNDLPSEAMLQATHQLINEGVKAGYIDCDYELFGHRQVRPTECPGDALFNEISTWSHFNPKPPHVYEPPVQG